MSLGEKATLTITGYAQQSINHMHGKHEILTTRYSDYAYGAQGFPGLIPPNATLVL